MVVERAFASRKNSRSGIFAVFLVIDKFILKTFKTVSAEFKLLMADIKRVSSGLNSLIHTDRKSAEAKLRIYIKRHFQGMA